MVSDYSSYLEFIGAVFFTMSLDEILTKKIWSPQDLKKQKRALDGLDIRNDKSLRDAIIDANKLKGECLQAELSKKSVLGLFMVGGLLLLCGFEQSLNDIALKNLHLSLAYTMLAYMLSMTLGLVWVVFKKWQYTTLYTISLFVLFLSIYYFNWIYGQTDIENWIDSNIGIVTCIVISLPIIKQILLTWLYKSVFYGYIKDRIRRANANFNEVLKNISDGNVDKLPGEYQKIYLRLSTRNKQATNSQTMDDSLTEYQGVLYNDIRRIGMDVRMAKLLFSWVWYRVRNLCRIIKNVFESKNLKETLVGNDYESHAKRYKTLKEKTNMKMKEYCEMEKIDYNEFQKYYCTVQNPKVNK